MPVIPVSSRMQVRRSPDIWPLFTTALIRCVKVGCVMNNSGKQLLDNVQWRRDCAAKVGLSFTLPTEEEQPLQNFPELVLIRRKSASCDETGRIYDGALTVRNWTLSNHPRL